MKKVYLITNKSFYVGSDGCDYQIADYGSLPQVLTSLKKATQVMESMKKTHVEIFNERIIEDYPDGKEGEHRLISEFVCYHDKSQVRTIISLWCDYYF